LVNQKYWKFFTGYGNICTTKEGQAVEQRLITLSISEIKSSPDNPRKNYDESDLMRLADSIKRNGLLQPVVVRKTEKGYILIAGGRRLSALQILGEKTVSCLVQKSTNLSAAVLSIIENIQRKDLNPFEEAEAIDKLINGYHMSQNQVAERLGIAPSTLCNKLRLLNLSEQIRDILERNNLTERHARALLSLPREKQGIVLSKIIEKRLNVADTERLCESLQKPEKTAVKVQSAPKKIAVVTDFKIFTNSFLKMVDTMRKSGINAKTAKTETDDFIEYTVRIAKSG
jgi:hypothetical protein